MNFELKIMPFDQLQAWRERVRALGKRLVATNGCFDLLHAGHVRYLAAAKAEGDLLLVGLNSDESVRALKGPSRPLNSEQDRAVVLAALESVDIVTVFPEVRAVAFLDTAQPDVYVKGGDYTENELPLEEREVVRKHGGIIKVLALVPGRSTTALLERAGGKL
jgi:D-glycero-beta-D-manno-heptose 1-phosphate adenylyltransferase